MLLRVSEHLTEPLLGYTLTGVKSFCKQGHVQCYSVQQTHFINTACLFASTMEGNQGRAHLQMYLEKCQLSHVFVDHF